MAALGQLVVSLSANIAEFTSAMGKAAFISEKRMADIQKSVKAAATAVGAAGAAAATGLAYMTKEAIDAADANTKLARSAGVSVETLTTLGYAAQLSGSSTEQLGKAFAKLGKNIADAAAGTGEAKGAFEALGISVKNSDGTLKSADAVLKEMSDKFAGYQDGAAKSALAMRIFGEEGIQLVSMLNSGAAGLEAMQDEARALGVGLTTDAGQAAEQFNDNITRLQTASAGFANQLAQALLPTLMNLTDGLVASAKESGAFANAVAAAATGAKLLLSVGTVLAGVFSAVGTALGGVTAQITALFEGRFRDALNVGAMTVDDFVANLSATAASVNGIWDAAANKAAASADTTGAKIAAPILAAADKAKKAKKEMDSIWSAEAAGAEAGADRFMKMMDEASAAFDRTRTPVEQLGANLARLQELLDAGAINWDTYGRAVMAAQDDFDALTNKVRDDADLMKTYAEQAGRNIQDAFAEFLFDPFKDGVGGMLENFTVMLRKMAAQQLAAGLLKGLGNWGSTGGGSGTFIGGIVSGLFGGGKAMGGPVEPGRSYLVGEQGPELIHIGAHGGTVTPNDKLGGKTINVVNHFTLAQPTDRRTQEQIAALAGTSIQSALARSA